LKLEVLQQWFTVFITNITYVDSARCRSRVPRGLRRRSAAARLLRLWVRIPPTCMEICCEYCVLSGRGLCDGLITRPEDSYRLWRVVVCDLGTSRMKRPWPELGLSAMGRGRGRKQSKYVMAQPSVWVPRCIDFYQNNTTVCRTSTSGIRT
jgi:hypothetical protein